MLLDILTVAGYGVGVAIAAILGFVLGRRERRVKTVYRGARTEQLMHDLLYAHVRQHEARAEIIDAVKRSGIIFMEKKEVTPWQTRFWNRLRRGRTLR